MSTPPGNIWCGDDEVVFAIHQGGLGTFFYRMAPPDTF